MMERRKTPLEQVESQKLGELLGERGDPNKHALRRAQLNEVRLLIATVTKQAKTIQIALTIAETAIDEVEGDVTALEADIATLQGNVTTINADLSAAQGTLDALVANVAGLTTAIADVPAHGAALAALGAVSVPTITAADAAADPPTAAEFNAVVADLNALRAAVAAIVGAGL